nr:MULTISPECIES: hypothetical protein [unclassified Mesotoga]
MVSKTNGMRLVQSLRGIEVTERLSVLTSKFLDNLERVAGFVLKAASPTCGVKDVKLCPGEGKVVSSGRDAGFSEELLLQNRAVFRLKTKANYPITS